MAIATWQLDRTDHRHPAVGAGRPARRPATARRPAPLHPAPRAATRAGGRAQARRRLGILALLVIAAVLALGPVVGSAAADIPGDPAPPPTAHLVIGQGETVWDLAAPHAPAGANVEVYVAEVLAHNGLEATAVAPGTVVRLP